MIKHSLNLLSRSIGFFAPLMIEDVLVPPREGINLMLQRRLIKQINERSFPFGRLDSRFIMNSPVFMPFPTILLDITLDSNGNWIKEIKFFLQESEYYPIILSFVLAIGCMFLGIVKSINGSLASKDFILFGIIIFPFAFAAMIHVLAAVSVETQKRQIKKILGTRFSSP